MTIATQRPFVLVMNNENRHLTSRRLAGPLSVVLAAVAAGCGLPPDGTAEHAGPAPKVLVVDPPPCPGGTPDAILDFAFSCGPDGSWRMVVRQEWKCADGELRAYTRERRVARRCDPV